MRKDKKLQLILDKERKEEAKTGCCIGTDQNGCIQTSEEMCKVEKFQTIISVLFKGPVRSILLIQCCHRKKPKLN